MFLLCIINYGYTSIKLICHGLIKSVWQMLRVYGVGLKLMKEVQSFYVDSWMCGWVGNDASGFQLMLD